MYSTVYCTCICIGKRNISSDVTEKLLKIDEEYRKREEEREEKWMKLEERRMEAEERRELQIVAMFAEVVKMLQNQHDRSPLPGYNLYTSNNSLYE